MAARARNTIETAKSIAERALPGWQALEPSGPIHHIGVGYGRQDFQVDATMSASVDAVMPADQALHDKFFGADGSDVASFSDAAPVHPAAVQLVDVKSGDLHKTVGVNMRDGTIEWSEG